MGRVFHGGDWLLRGTGNGSGSVGPAFDNRAGQDVGFLYYSAEGASAIATVMASHDATAWLPVLTVTAVTGAVGGTAQIAGFYPYLAAQINALYSGAAGTAMPIIHFTPGAV